MNKIVISSLIFVLFLIIACNNKETTTENIALPKPVVGIVYPVLGDIQEKIQLNGQVVYLNKTDITAPISGYVTLVNSRLGDWVKKGNLLFKIQTKESQALQYSSVSIPDNFGIINVYASTSGFINSLNISDTGVFISEGNTMATIVNNQNLAIQVNLPFQYNKLLNASKAIEVELPNNEIKMAIYYKAMPLVDPVSQTQQVFFKLSAYSVLPENLNVLVKFIKQDKRNITLLPKDAVLTNESQDTFWVLKITQDSLAIKIPIIKGLEIEGSVEIISPNLKLSDMIVKNGGFGLPDSTKVKIEQ
ncbi:MAG: HlyD family efflux transporter periplasmic adaptor subunit [Saprospiraceae bacterium]